MFGRSLRERATALIGIAHPDFRDPLRSEAKRSLEVSWLANDRVCPLTPLAERYGAARGSVSDIWLPEPIARTIPRWSIPLVVSAILLHTLGAFRMGARDVTSA